MQPPLICRTCLSAQLPSCRRRPAPGGRGLRQPQACLCLYPRIIQPHLIRPPPLIPLTTLARFLPPCTLHAATARLPHSAINHHHPAHHPNCRTPHPSLAAPRRLCTLAPCSPPSLHTSLLVCWARAVGWSPCVPSTLLYCCACCCGCSRRCCCRRPSLLPQLRLVRCIRICLCLAPSHRKLMASTRRTASRLSRRHYPSQTPHSLVHQLP